MIVALVAVVTIGAVGGLVLICRAMDWADQQEPGEDEDGRR